MMQRQLKRFEVVTIGPEALPLLVMADNLFSLFGAGIRIHTQGYYNHAMWMHRCGTFASQDLFYHEVPVWKYLKTHRLKFWRNPAWTATQKSMVREEIVAKLHLPWYRRFYDFKGILGQWLRKPSFNWDWWDYCSEDAAEKLALVETTFDLKHPSPADIDRWCKGQPQMEVFGVHDPDTA